ncbi:MAG: hypothetical protein MR210_00640 [Erysipelotrichaceae bacterium]|nr:hypothetical protein [Erysipelotrichaceae bacterium]
MIITNDGIVIRISLNQVGIYKRQTQGVKLIKVDDASKVSTVAVVAQDEEMSEEEEA